MMVDAIIKLPYRLGLRSRASRTLPCQPWSDHPDPKKVKHRGKKGVLDAKRILLVGFLPQKIPNKLQKFSSTRKSSVGEVALGTYFTLFYTDLETLDVIEDNGILIDWLIDGVENIEVAAYMEQVKSSGRGSLNHLGTGWCAAWNSHQLTSTRSIHVRDIAGGSTTAIRISTILNCSTSFAVL
ncbi:hypothetical protein R3P38DRAFT_2785826 [Favolaschia claudopus]|uniref:Uncharacterized protein n=1 Tax=Favolaschia claudopus TaxID=2862362 RepID=A0AAW0AVI7_9AGAR